MNIHCRALFLALAILVLVLTACNNVEQEPAPVLSRDHLYFYYTVSGAENQDSVLLKFEFRQTSKSRGLYLGDSAGVALDGEKIKADSVKYSGVFYETSRPLASFAGRHSISFKGTDGKELDQSFLFLPFSLAGELPRKISRKPFSIRINNPDTSLKVLQLVMVDTSFNSRDVNDDVAVSNGEIIITDDMWSRLANGPIILELHSEINQTLSPKPVKGGRMVIFYSLNREFELVD